MPNRTWLWLSLTNTQPQDQRGIEHLVLFYQGMLVVERKDGWTLVTSLVRGWVLYILSLLYLFASFLTIFLPSFLVTCHSSATMWEWHFALTVEWGKPLNEGEVSLWLKSPCLSRTGIFHVLFALFFLNTYEHYPSDSILSSSPHSFKPIPSAHSVHR